MLKAHYAESFYLSKEAQELPEKGWANTLYLMNTLTDDAARILLDLLLNERIKGDEVTHIDYCIPYEDENEDDLVAIIELESRKLVNCVWLIAENVEDHAKWIRNLREVPF
jgi:hypothetical protein